MVKYYSLIEYLHVFCYYLPQNKDQKLPECHFINTTFFVEHFHYKSQEIFRYPSRATEYGH